MTSSDLSFLAPPGEVFDWRMVLLAPQPPTPAC